MRQIKVALFTGNYNHIRDGVSLTLNWLVKFLENNGVKVLVFGPTIKEPQVDHAGTLIPVPSVKAPGRPEYRLTTGLPKKQVRELENFDPDLVHIATPDILGYKAMKWAKKNNKTVVASFHTHFASYLKYYKLGFMEPLGWRYLKWFYENCKQVYVPTPSMAQELKDKNIKTDFRIWARGVETDKFNPGFRSEEWRSENGIDKNDVVVLFVSRLVWEKNLKLYADVINELKKDHSNMKAVIAGDGPAMDDMKELLPDAVFTGFLKGDDLSKVYASGDIFFFPSDTETFGNVTLEAMASGLPCVVADAPGSKSLVDHEKNGYITDISNFTKVKNAVEKLIVDQKLRKKFSKESLERSKNYSRDVINQKLLNDYSEALVD